MHDVIAQSIGFVGTLLFVAAFQCRSSRTIVLLQMFSCILYVIHFFMLGAYAGCANLFISTLANGVVCCAGKSWADWKGWLWCFPLLYLTVTFFTWQGFPSILAFSAAAANTFINLMRNARVIRMTRLCAVSPTWLIYDLCVFSYAGILAEILTMCSILVYFKRAGLRKAPEEAGALPVMRKRPGSRSW